MDPEPIPTEELLAVMAAHPSFTLAIRERRRQVEQLGFTAMLDATRQSRMQLSRGAACFLRQAILLTTVGAGATPGQPFPEWPWPADTWNPPHTAEEALVKAMALIAAELDRIRAAGAQETQAARIDTQP